MVLDYSKVKVDADGRPVQPDLHLQTLDGTEIGVIPYVSELKLTINYSDVSEIEFDVPYYVNGAVVPIYSQISSYKRIYTENYGIYVVTSPEKEGDGMTEVKHVHGYSLEKLFDNKQLYLEQGTYRFCNPVDESGTILGMILELDSSWSAGTIDSKFTTMYRTFDEYDGKALSFCYNEALDKFGCVFVFDPYQKKVHIKDAYSDANTLPIYLDYNNLVQEVQVEEISDDIVTKLHPYGADSLNIRSVNPTGADYIVNLDYFISNGDLDITPTGSSVTLATKVEAWEAAILAQQTYYTGLVAAKASQTSMKLTAQAQLTELQNELDELTTEQNVLIQGVALDPDSTTLQTQLEDKYDEIVDKKEEIEDKEDEINDIQTLIDSYTTQITTVTEQLSYETYFTAAERSILDNYMIEEDLTEETFVCTDLNTTASGDIDELASGTISVTGSDVAELDLTASISKKIYTVRGGNLAISAASITAEIISGTVEIASSGAVVGSFYLGDLTYGTTPADGGLIVVTGTRSSSSYTTTNLSVSVTDGQTFFTVNASDYQRYSVQQELYDFAVEVLDDSAWPVYEFSMDAANFMFLKGFEAFRDEVVLGSAVYLRLGSEGVVTPALIGLTLDFSDMTTTELTFSNQYQRKNGVETLGDMIRGSYSSSRTFNVSKYLYDLVGEQATDVSRFMSGSLDAAVNRIKAAQNQSITIDSNGIAVTDDSGDYPGHELRLVSNMLAMTDDNWQHAKLAIGYFQPSGDEFDEPYWGVNADVIAGKLLVGQNLIIQANKTESGSEVVTFKVDSTGAYLYNARFDLKKNFTKSGQAYIGRISLYPVTGFIGGATLSSSDIYTYDATTGEITGVRAIKDGSADTSVTRIADLPTGYVPAGNFWLDMEGDAYFKGKIIATDGEFSGELKGATGTFAGELQAATGTFSGSLSAATGTFAGSLSAATGTFAGDLSAAGGTFSGDLSAAGGTFTGELQAATGTFEGEVKAEDFLLWDDDAEEYVSILDTAGEKIDGEFLKDGSVDTDQLAANAITTDKLAAGCVTAEKLAADVTISRTVIAESIYADFGDVSDITVDRLSTSKKVPKYLLSDTSDDNYIEIMDKEVSFKTGTYAGSTTQLQNRDGENLWWDHDMTNAYIDSDGVPWTAQLGGERITATTDAYYKLDTEPSDWASNYTSYYTKSSSGVYSHVTGSTAPTFADGTYYAAKTLSWRVMVYTYTVLTKMKFWFEMALGTYVPRIDIGAGDSSGGSKASIIKTTTGIMVQYICSNNTRTLSINMSDDGYIDVDRMRRPTGFDFSGISSGSFSETVDGNQTYNYTVTNDSSGRISTITAADGHVTNITW